MEFVIATATWTLTWAALHVLSHFALRLTQGKVYTSSTRDMQDYLCACIVSITMSFILVRKVLLIGQETGVGIRIYEIPLDYTSKDSSETICLLLGYFMYDLPLTLWWRKQWPDVRAMLVHHIMGLMSYSALLIYGAGHSCGMTGMVLEGTNLFVNMRAILDKLGYKERFPVLYLFNGIGITISFFLARVLYFTYAGYHVIYYHRDTFFGTLSGGLSGSILVGYIFGLSLQYMWFYKIFTGLIKVVSRTMAGSYSKGDKEEQPRESKADNRLKTK